MHFVYVNYVNTWDCQQVQIWFYSKGRSQLSAQFLFNVYVAETVGGGVLCETKSTYICLGFIVHNKDTQTQKL